MERKGVIGQDGLYYHLEGGGNMWQFYVLMGGGILLLLLSVVVFLLILDTRRQMKEIISEVKNYLYIVMQETEELEGEKEEKGPQKEEKWREEAKNALIYGVLDEFFA